MKDGIGKGYTREDHQDLANQLFSSYARVGEARNLASVIGEDELSPVDKKYLEFGTAMEQEFIAQGHADPFLLNIVRHHPGHLPVSMFQYLSILFHLV